MEVALPDPQTLPEPLRRRRLTPLPLSQLVEESKSTSKIPNHLLESKIYARLKSNSLIEAEPPELHFGGFELGRTYTKSLKIINISSEVMTVHIIATQTKHFETTYTKKYRLIPGLAYTVKVRFCPDEWRYFYDSVRIHCKGEDNLLVPVHAYPVVDDLHIPPRVDLSPIPLGQSVSHAIPLRCSCPVDFEFQVFVIQPHEAFSITPLTGLIPASGEVNITVTFSPLQYETAQVTMQLIISQFNTKPYLCTITGSSSPYLTCRELGRKSASADAAPYSDDSSSPASKGLRLKSKQRATKEAEKSTALKNPANKHGSKDLMEASLCGRTDDTQKRRIKEAQLMKKAQQNKKEHRGQDRLSDDEDATQDETMRQILKEGEIAQKDNKVPIRCRMKSHTEKSVEDESTEGHSISPDKVFPFDFPVFNEEDDLLTSSDLAELPVERTDVNVTTHIPLFNLQEPQHYKLMGYQPVSAWDAFNCYFPTSLARPLQTGPPLEAEEMELRAGDEQQQDSKKQDAVAWKDLKLTFSAPESLLKPFPANPLRIFNPAPGLQSYQTTPKYLETDLEFHLCPLPRYLTPEDKAADLGNQTSHTQKVFLDRQEVIPGLMTWKNFDLITPKCPSNQPVLNCHFTKHRSVVYNTDLLPTEAPPPLTGPSDDLEPLRDNQNPTVQLTPEMIRAEFLPRKASTSNSRIADDVTIGEELQVEEASRLEFNHMGRRVMTRLKQLLAADRTSPPPGEEDSKKIPTQSQKQHNNNKTRDHK